MTQPGPVVGIDVAKAELVVAVRPRGRPVARAQRCAWPRRASGCGSGTWRPPSSSLRPPGATNGRLSPPSRRPSCRSVVVNPRQVRDFARGHRPTREDGPHRRRHPRAVCGTRPPDPTAVARCGLGRARCPAQAAPAAGGHAGRRAQSARARGGPRPAGHPPPHPLARTPARHGRSGPRRLDPAEPRLAREGQPPALGAGRRPHREPHAPGGAPGARPAESQTHRRPRGRRAAGPRQWDAPRQTESSGGGGPRCVRRST